MTTKIGINGFGRIGRQVLKGIMDYHRDDLEVVAVNDLTDTATNAHLFKYDSNYGRYPGTVSVEDGGLMIDGQRIAVLAERDPGQIPLGGLRRGDRGRIDGHLHGRQEGRCAPQPRAQEGCDLGAGQQ